MKDTARSPGALDAQELLHLAVRAMQQDRNDDAIAYLKRGLTLEPRNGVMHYLLGAMYAQLAMIDRAIEEMTLAVNLAPQLHTARFQLGLLHFTSTDVVSAEKAWDALSELPAEHPLRLFRSGLLHLARDEFAECVAELHRGIERNVEYPSLNRDMKKVADKAEETMVLAKQKAAESIAPEAPSMRHVLLSGYQGLTPDKTGN